MSKFRVLHNYGSEGWQPVGEDRESLYETVMAREADLANGGGESIIVEIIDIIDAYRRADYDRDRIAREKAGV